MYTEDVTEDELENAKQQIIAAIVLGMENSSNRMSRLAECEMYFGDYLPMDFSIAQINAVTRADVHAIAEKYLKDRPITFASIGPEKRFQPYLGGLTF